MIGSRLLDDRAIAGGMPRWKWLGNRLLTGIENRAFGVRFSEYHTGYRAFSAPTSCARSRSCATPTTSSSTRRSSPRCSRAARAWWRSRSRRATSTRPRASTSSRACATRCKTLWVLGRFLAHRLDRRWTLLRRSRRLASHRPTRGPVRGRRGVILVGRAGDPRRVRRWRPRASARPRRARLRRPRGRRSRSGHGFALVLRPPDRVPPARLPVSSLAGVYKVAGVARTGVARGCASRGSRNAFVGTGDRRADRAARARSSGGRREALVALALAAVYVPLILDRAVGDVRAAVRALHARLARAAIAHRRSVHRYRWAVAAGVLVGLAILGRANALILLAAAGARGLGPPAAVVGPPLAPPVVLALVASRRSRRGRSATSVTLHALRPGLDPARLGAGGHVQRRGAGGHGATPRRGGRCKRVADYRPIFTQRPRARTRPCSRSSCASASIDYIKRPPGLRRRGRVLDDARGCSTSPGWTGRATPRRRSASTRRLGDRGRHLLLDLRAARGRRRVHAAARAAHAVVRVGGPGC